MGEMPFLVIFLYTIDKTAFEIKITSARQSKLTLRLLKEESDSTTDNTIVIPVETIRPTTTGLTPFRKALTPANFIKPDIKDAITKIIIKDGKTTPNVAIIAPNIPP